MHVPGLMLGSQLPGPDSMMSFRNVMELIRGLEPFAISIIGAYVSIKLRGIHTLVNSTATEQRQTISRLEGEKATLTTVITQLTAQRVAGEAVLSEKNAIAVERALLTPSPFSQPQAQPIAVQTLPGKPLEVVPPSEHQKGT